MSAEAALTRSWTVGDRTCKLTLGRPKPACVMQAVLEWAPTEPTRLSDDEWRQYRLGRHEALTSLADELGITVAVLDL